MLSKTIQDAMNEQIKNELYSAYQYLSMSAYCESVNLPEFAHWMRVQFREETEHALKFYDFIQDRGGRATRAKRSSCSTGNWAGARTKSSGT